MLPSPVIENPFLHTHSRAHFSSECLSVQFSRKSMSFLEMGSGQLGTEQYDLPPEQGLILLQRPGGKHVVALGPVIWVESSLQVMSQMSIFVVQKDSNKCFGDGNYFLKNIKFCGTIRMLDYYENPESGILNGNLKCDVKNMTNALVFMSPAKHI
ncbi:hypothetical protein TNIN_188061 [Trichonephila inaurata madagascariensis]|uniref:Uncharacterized protein n=1 Tax=Trichonephila inaurata madagascariensis TaxID=2747483 RepID=A0A8X6X018_9ARAC|nr:hypothetical protein TNIN_188061 [Trichonephila inaurata madagascariensis]